MVRQHHLKSISAYADVDPDIRLGMLEKCLVLVIVRLGLDLCNGAVVALFHL